MKKSVTPIEIAVMPLKEAAVARAVKYAQDIITHTLDQLAADGWDADKSYPYPKSGVGRNAYMLALMMHNRPRMLTKATWTSKRPNAPDTRVRCEACEAHFLKQTAKAAAAQYDAFVAKLVAKIGPHESATLAGDHVWSHSILTVVALKDHEGGLLEYQRVTERWKTQTIINVSKLGKVFNQWPTRKVK